MINSMYKPKGSRIWRWKFRLRAGDEKIEDVSLGTSDKQVAEKKRAELVREREHERAGFLPPQPMREAAARPLVDHLEDFIHYLESRKRSAKYTSNMEHHAKAVIEECGWKHTKDVTADSFQVWRAQ